MLNLGELGSNTDELACSCAPSMKSEEPLPTRASLLQRLKDAGDHASWEEFHRTYRGLLVGVARRAGLDEGEAEEAVQDTLIGVARKLPDFQYDSRRDSFKGWLLQLLRWKVADQFRRRSRQAGAASTAESPSVAERLAVVEGLESEPVHARLELSDPQQEFEAIWDAEWHRHRLEQALTRVKRQARPEHYAIYHLHVVEERPVEEVRRILGVSAAAVYLAKHRVGNLFRKVHAELKGLE